MTLQPIGLNSYMLQAMPNYVGSYNNTVFNNIFGADSVGIQQVGLNYIDPFAAIYTGNTTNEGALPYNYSMYCFLPEILMPTNIYPQMIYPSQQYNFGLSKSNFDLHNIPKFGELTKKTKAAETETKKEERTISSLNLSDKELDRLGFNTPNLKERWKHLKPEFQKALIKLTDYAESQGIKISYGRRSTWRSHQDQIDLKKERGSLAAKPGNSPHEKGIAVDITTTSVNGNKRSNRENQALLGAYWEKMGYRWGGHFQNFAKEPWHFDLKAARS